LHVCMASESGSPMVPNEDWGAVTPGAIIVLDGVTIPEGMDQDGCMHSTPWYVQELGLRLLTGASDPAIPLPVVLENAITAVAKLHGDTCDLSSPASPSAAVAMVRFSDDRMEHLVLADATIAIQNHVGEIVVVTDDRVDASVAAIPRQGARVGTLIGERRAIHRNQPGGYWVAAAEPEAAAHALTGDVSLKDLTRVAVMTDGASRASDMFAMPWETTLRFSPKALINQVRRRESSDLNCVKWPRFKVSDDATVAIWESVEDHGIAGACTAPHTQD
jgi:hypothetical protein